MTAWLAEIVIISYRATRPGANEGTANIALPMPSQYAATFIIYGALGLLPQSAAKFASLTGWGFVLATLLNVWEPYTVGTKPKVALNGKKTAAGNTTTTPVKPTTPA